MVDHNPVTIKGKDATTGLPTDIVVIGGAASVVDGFKPSQDYISDLTMNGTGQAVALATGTNRITVWNKGATTEDIRIAFGTSSANAIANLTISGAPAAATTGIQIPPYADNGAMCLQMFGVPANATHVAVANAVASDVQTVQIVQGV